MVVSRLLTGVAIAVNQVVCGAYLTDIAPAEQRGRVNVIGSTLPLR